MAVRRLLIDGFRSVDDLDLRLGRVNAIIGPNNAGKSNILRALNLVLGESYPTRPFTARDRHQHDANRTIEITAFFEQPLRCDADVHGLRLRYAPTEDVDYEPVDDAGVTCTWAGGRDKKVSAAMRDEAALLFVGLDRQADRQLRTSHWTLYGKLLRKIEQQITQQQRDAFSNDVRQSIQANLQVALAPVQVVLQEFVRRQTGLDSELRFRAVDPLDVLQGVRPYIVDGIDLDAEDVGAGVQSAVAIAIAKAYADYVRRPVILAIEEPELYLHPHGCRHFYRLLNELSGPNLQIVYTTHNRSLINAGEFEQIHLVRKQASTTIASGLRIPFNGPRDRLRLQTRFNERVSESLFANVVVLTEAEPDEIAVRCALESTGMELDKSSISVLGVGGKTEVNILAELLTAFQIPTIAVLDEDPGDPTSAINRTRVEQTLGTAQRVHSGPKFRGIAGTGAEAIESPSNARLLRSFPSRSAAPTGVYRHGCAHPRSLVTEPGSCSGHSGPGDPTAPTPDRGLVNLLLGL